MSSELIARLFLALALIVSLAFICTTIFRRLNQPVVIGEVLIGVLLGPTWMPELSHAIFPDEIQQYLTVIASVGVALFMFMVGTEIDSRLLRGRGAQATTIAIGSIVLPFGLGTLLAIHLLTTYNPNNSTAFILFMGVAMSVTAFPVLARIILDRKMGGTWIGNLALACAAVDDVLAWTLLAVVVSIAGGGTQWLTLLLLPYLAIMLLVARPMLRLLLNRIRDEKEQRTYALRIALAGILLSSAFTEWIGLHFIFGAFIFGLVMPRHSTVAMPLGITVDVTDRIDHLNRTLFLPAFFIVAGLKVDLSGLTSGDALDLLLILGVAVGGKYSGAFLGAKLSRVPNKQASIIAILLNTRGLTEMIVLGVGLELKVIDLKLYSLMVVMALVTTAMTGPAVQRLYTVPPAGRDQPTRAGADEDNLGGNTSTN